VDAAQSAKILGISIIPSSASQRLCGRNWFVGDGAFAPESWVRSASRPYPFFSIREDSPFAVRTRTAEDCRGYNAPLSVSPCLRESPCFYIAGTAFAPLFAALGLGGRIWFGETAHSRLNFGSARRSDPTIFSIREDLCHSRACSRTAEDCRCYNASLRDPVPP
jgi:hypothetical protein